MTYDVLATVEALGVEKVGENIYCPFHDDTGRPNMHIYPDGAYCFRCGKQATAEDLVTAIMGWSPEKVAAWVSGIPRVIKKPQSTALSNQSVLYAHFCVLAARHLHKSLAGLAFLQERGIEPRVATELGIGVIDKANIGYIDENLRASASLTAIENAGIALTNMENRLLVPFRTASGVVGYQGRILGSASVGPKYQGPRGVTLPLYCAHLLKGVPLGEVVWVCEGPLDTVLAIQHGLLAVGVPGSNAWRDTWASALLDFDIVFATDADEAGRGLFREIRRSLFAAGYKRKNSQAILPEGTDLTDWWREHKEIPELEKLS